MDLPHSHRGQTSNFPCLKVSKANQLVARLHFSTPKYHNDNQFYSPSMLSRQILNMAFSFYTASSFARTPIDMANDKNILRIKYFTKPASTCTILTPSFQTTFASQISLQSHNVEFHLWYQLGGQLTLCWGFAIDGHNESKDLIFCLFGPFLWYFVLKFLKAFLIDVK